MSSDKHPGHLELPAERCGPVTKRYVTPGVMASPVAWQDLTRSPFERDYDKIIFSKHFRRLADKTQVVALPKDDHTHTRLLHSLEVAAVGRSIVSALVAHNVLDPSQKDDLLRIVETACVAHDIGNPPFGHEGERALRAWWKDFSERLLTDEQTGEPLKEADFEHFDGNAMGFTILCELGVTQATLLAYSKYTVSGEGIHDGMFSSVSDRKSGALKNDLPHLKAAMASAGLPSFGGEMRRHPLAFIVEAADDICNFAMDIEDCMRLGFIPEEEACDLFHSAVRSMHHRAGLTGKRQPASPLLARLNELGATERDPSLRIEAQRSFLMHYAVLFAAFSFEVACAKGIASWDRNVALNYELGMYSQYQQVYFNHPNVVSTLMRGTRALTALMQNCVMSALATYPIAPGEMPPRLTEALAARSALQNRAGYNILSETARQRLQEASHIKRDFRHWIYETVTTVAFFVFGMTDAYALKTAEMFSL